MFKGDRQTRGHVFLVALLWELVLFGPELRVGLEASRSSWVNGAVCLNLFLSWVLFYFAIHQEYHRSGNGVGGAGVRTRLADKNVASRVYDYAEALLGRRNHFQVRVVPGISASARVFGSPQNQFLIMTGALHALGKRRNIQEARDFFDFHVDHELGHIASGDAHLLYFVQALHRAAFLGFSFKFLLIFNELGWESVVYRSATLTEDFLGISMGLDLFGSTVLTLFIFLAGLLLILIAHVTMVHRREFLADRFAWDLTKSTKALQRARFSIKKALDARLNRRDDDHTHSSFKLWFRTVLRNTREWFWHPRLEQRLRWLDKAHLPPPVNLPHLLTLVLTLNGLRFYLGINGAFHPNPDAPWLMALLTACFVLIIFFLLDGLLISGSDYSTPSPIEPSPWRTAMFLILITWALALLQLLPWLLNNPWSIREGLIRIGFHISLPIIITLFTLSILLFRTFRQRSRKHSFQYFSILISLGVGLLLIHFTGVAWNAGATFMQEDDSRLQQVFQVPMDYLFLWKRPQ